MYDCLPMYHTVGGLVATGAVLLNGGSVVIREKFSVNEFWDDIVRQRMHDVPLHRRAVPLSGQPAAKPQRDASTICGWPAATACGPTCGTEFQTRFRIPQILEFYGATEGNVSIFNFEGKPGAVGRVPWFVAHRFPIAVVKFDVERQQPVRNAKGFCERCEPNEPGEVIGRIVNDAQSRAIASRATPPRTRTSIRSCAMCSRKATPGFAPAI